MADTGSSSCRPDRLQAFGNITEHMAEGLGNRLNTMKGYMDRYMKGCDPNYRVDVTGLPDEVGGLGIKISNWGKWTAGIGTSFEEADHTTQWDTVQTLPDSQIFKNLPQWYKGDPTLGHHATEKTPIDWSKHPDIAMEMLKDLLANPNELNTAGIALTQGGLSITQAYASFGKKLATDMLEQVGIEPGALADQSLIDSGDYLLAGAGFATAFASEWKASKGLSDNEKMANSMIVAGGTTGAALLVGGYVTAITSEAAPFNLVLGAAAGTGVAVLTTLGLGKYVPFKPNPNDPRVADAYDKEILRDVGSGQLGSKDAATQTQSMNQAAYDEAAADQAHNPQIAQYLASDKGSAPKPPG